MEDKLDQLNDNLPEISVSELSNQVKFTVETAFGRVRVRGEISRPKKAASGHLYLTLKDDRSVIDGVCWKGNAQRLAVQPQEGMDGTPSKDAGRGFVRAAQGGARRRRRGLGGH